jgi:hypothetical protein
MVCNQEIQVAVAVEVSNPNVARQMSGGKGRAGRLAKVSLPIPKQNGHSAVFWICRNDIHGTVVIDVGYCNRIGIATSRNHYVSKFRSIRAPHLP